MNKPSMSLPQRKSIRAFFHDYSGGLYFVTICTKNRKHLFGHIKNVQMHLSEIGHITVQYIGELNSTFPYCDILHYIVMPNHFHAIIDINIEKSDNIPLPKNRSLLSVVIGHLKQRISKYAKSKNIKFEWQKGYYDRIIRNINEATQISNYIKGNVANWDKDEYYDDM